MNISIPARFSIEDLRARARAHLSAELPADAFDPAFAPSRGDHVLNAPAPDAQAVANARPAAVLAPIVARPDGPTVLLTLRASSLRSHSGQVAFPGGKIDEGETPLAAALREAQEEIGLDPGAVEPLGWLDPYLTGTGYRIMPLVGIVEPPLALALNPAEVEDVFEAPLSFLMNEANHQRHAREWQGGLRHFYAMPWRERYIWGATAGILRNLYERLYS
ncbi:CoA pyrophosphatase [Methylocapsa sp. S129]|uniref:CoA pyrophosphatase n=1 Tax=Methylocapsa sp. S129 TaxID=1641869 RepID=UPI001FF06E02|nr:CoA pyrophosphatase [Methylocapsa sp. S129]